MERALDILRTPTLAGHYVDGMWIDEGPKALDSIDPATGQKIGQAAAGSASIAQTAIEAARRAFETSNWASEPRLRADVLDQFAARLSENRAALSELLVRENGKVHGQAVHEIAAAASEARYYSGLARNIFGRTTETGPSKISLLTREPAGVVAVIVPWNAPVTLLVRSVAPALAAGCTVVIKPAPQTPLINAAVIQCFAGIDGLPAGVVNSINEHGIEVGQALASSAEVDVISFTGSSRTGKAILATAAPTLKRHSLELGGKAPAIVFADADLDRSVAEIRRSSIVLTGQMCTAVSRVLAQDSIVDDLADRLAAAYRTVRVGHGLDGGVEMGPLIDRPSQTRILRLIEQAGDEGELLVQGQAPGGDLAAGSFVTPTLFRIDDVASPLVQDELFGPIVSLETFADEADAIAKANATRYGLAASVYTNDLHRSMRMSRALRFGTVWLNCHNRLMAEAETGGFRESGLGRLHGVEGMNDFLETKHVFIDAEEPWR